MEHENSDFSAPASEQLASMQARFGAALLDATLLVVTLVVGWLIWSLFTWQSGQSPAKQILKQVVVDANTGERFTWAKMALREFAIKGLLGQILSGATNGITFVIDSLFVFRSDRRTVHDLIVGSKVIQL